MTDIMKYEEVTGDMCGIVGRLKEIDESYFVLRRRKSGRLELHSNAQKGGSLCAVLPYERLDCCTLEYARRTRRERAERLVKELERENEKLLRSQMRVAAEAAERGINCL